MRKGLTELYLLYGVLIRVSNFSILHSNLLCSSCISSHRHVRCISDGFFIVVIKVYVNIEEVVPLVWSLYRFAYCRHPYKIQKRALLGRSGPE